MTNFNLELYVVLKWRLGTPSSHTELGTLHEEWIHDLAHCAVFGKDFDDLPASDFGEDIADRLTAISKQLRYRSPNPELNYHEQMAYAVTREVMMQMGNVKGLERAYKVTPLVGNLGISEDDFEKGVSSMNSGLVLMHAKKIIDWIDRLRREYEMTETLSDHTRLRNQSDGSMRSSEIRLEEVDGKVVVVKLTNKYGQLQNFFA